MQRSKKILLFPFIFCLFLFFHTSCKKEEIIRIIKVTTDEVSQIATKSATVNGTIVDIGEGITEHGFCWSTTINPTIELTTKTQLGSKNSKGSFSSNLTNLTPNTTYYFRSYGSDGEITKYGNEKSFITESETSASITTGTVSEITDSTAKVTATISDLGNGIDSILQHGFCWSANQNPTIEDNKTELGSKSSTGEFSSNLTSLSPGTIYYVRAYATNSIGIAYGIEINFTTSAILPTVTTTSVTDITYNSATSGGDITDDGGASVTARGVCWSTSQNPTISDNYTSDGAGTGSFSSSITGLSPVTTYYVRAYAINSVGTAYGNENLFTTNNIKPIVFAANWDGNNNLYYMNPDGSEIERLTNATANESYPRWSPDGSKIAFSANYDGNYDIYVMNTDGSNLQNLTQNPAHEEYIAWSPDGSRIAFSSNRNGNTEIYIMNTSGSNQTRFTYSGSDDAVHMNWSPDGDWIVYSSTTNKSASFGYWRIVIAKSDGTAFYDVTDAYANTNPAWSNDGTKIAYMSWAGTSNSYCDQLWVADVSINSGVPMFSNNKCISNPSMRYGVPRWSPDNTKIIHTRCPHNTWNNTIHIMNVDGSNAVQITTQTISGFADWK